LFSTLLFFLCLGCSTGSEVSQIPAAELIEIKLKDEVLIKEHTISSGEFFSTLLQKNKFSNVMQITNHIKNSPIEWFNVDKVPTGQRIDFTISNGTGVSFRVYHRYRRNEYFDIVVLPEISINHFIGETTSKREYLKIKVTSSFWEAAKKLKLPDDRIYEMVTLFESQVDFATEVRSGDTLEVLADTLYYQGEFLDIGQFSAIRFTNNKEEHFLIRFSYDDEVLWLDSEGRQGDRPFLRSPLEYKRISSDFGVKRKRGYHGGIDFAAVTGTPVRTVADGEVILARWNGGYGNQVQVSHETYGPYVTTYGHLSKILVKKGQQVSQGELIGKVGSTGNSTGPHLHYELRVKGKRVHPWKTKLPYAKELPKDQKEAFLLYRDSILNEIQTQNKPAEEPK
jgi:murein DD-endopeptidase MepM/ murein hydrolase activator NlpD